MVAHARKPYISPEEYLRREDAAATKSEYVDGVIVAMSGATPEHAEITFNLATAIGPKLRDSRCRGFSADLRVRIEAANRYYYPDLTVVCGEPEYESRRGFRHLLNPTAIFEVLSDSTERRDRGEKWEAYWEIESLTNYVLIHQDRPFIELFSRKSGDDEWLATRVEGLDAVLKLPGIDCMVPLSEIYENLKFGEMRDA